MFWIALRQLWLNDHTKQFTRGGQPSRASLRETRSLPVKTRVVADRAGAESLNGSHSVFMDKLMSHCRDACCILDQQGAVLFISPNWKEATGLDTGESVETLGMDASQCKQIFSVLRASAQKSQGWKGCFPLPSAGDTRWLEWELIHREKSKEACKAAFMVRDVTDRMQAKQKLEEEQSKLGLAMKTRSEFLANMSHELRTPLNAILGFAQIMENRVFGDIQNPRYQSYLGNIKDSGEALLGRINDLLELSNIEAGKTSLNEEPTSLHEVVRFAVEVHSHNAFASDISVICKNLGEECWVQGDRVKLQQAIAHLLSNAIKFNRPGGFVTIEFRDRAKSMDIVISDSGEGIPESKLEMITGMLKRGERLWLSDIHVLGVGLALAQEYIGLHGGSLEVKSQYGKGTTVTLRLPRSRLITMSRPAGTGDIARSAEKVLN